MRILQTLAAIFLSLGSAVAQWAPVDSGTSSNLNGVFLLDSGVGFSVGDAGTILKTTDAGVTWSALTSGTTKALHDLYTFSASEAVAVGDNGLILRTTDGGASWQTVSSGVRDSLRSVSFSGTNGICGGLSQDILYSTDSGATWHVSQKGFFGGGFFGAHMLSPTVGFVAGQNSIFQGFVGVTTDGGVTWDFHPFYFDGNEGTCDDIFFLTETTGVTSGVLFDGTGAIARTTDAGVDWNSLLFPQGMQGIDFPKPEAGYAVGFGGAILKSADAGLSWTPQNSGTPFDLFDVHFASDALTGLAVGQAGTMLRTTNGGAEEDFELVAAVSRKGPFEIELPGVESRNANHRHFTLIFTFNHPVTAVGGFTASCGRFSEPTINAADPHEVLVSYGGATCNQSEIVLTLENVADDKGNALASAETVMGLLLGDVDGNGVVDDADVEQTELDLGQPTDASNFREDLDTDGAITDADVQAVRRKRGSLLPP